MVADACHFVVVLQDSAVQNQAGLAIRAYVERHTCIIQTCKHLPGLFLPVHAALPAHNYHPPPFAAAAQGKCYNGVCQAGNKLYEINSVGPILSASALPTTNSQWFWNRLYRSGFAVGEIVPLAGEDTRTTGYPVTVDPSVSTGAPEDLRTAGSQITTGLRMLNPGANYEDRVEAAVWYLNNTADHPVGLFNGMKVRGRNHKSASTHVCRRLFS